MSRTSCKTEPTKKVSEIFLRYVSPLFDGAQKNIAPEHLQHVLTVPTLIWNAVAMKRWGNSGNYVEDIIASLRKSGIPDLALNESLIHMWVQRKEELYPDEHWGIEDVQVYRDFSGELIVRVIARAPEEFKHQLPKAEFAGDYRSTLN